MTNKEKQYIKELGQLYVQTGEIKFLSCGGGYELEYKPVLRADKLDLDVIGTVIIFYYKNCSALHIIILRLFVPNQSHRHR